MLWRLSSDMILKWFLGTFIDSALCQWSPNKMTNILQIKFSNAFSWKKMFVFCLSCHRILSLGPLNNKLPMIKVMAWVVRIMIAIIYFIHSLRPSDAYMRQYFKPPLVQIMVCRLPASSYYMNQCWYFVNWALKNKFQWNIDRNSNIFIQENAFEYVFCEMVTILSRLQRVKTMWRIYIYVSSHRLDIGSSCGLFPYRSQAIFSNKDEESHI